MSSDGCTGSSTVFKTVVQASVVAAMLWVLFLPTVVGATVAPGGFVPCEGVNCSACDLVTMVQTIITWLIGIIFLIFAVLFLVSGFQLVTSGGNQNAVSDAKSKFTNSIIGLIIVLASWLLVDTLMRAVLPNDTGEIQGWGFWAEVQCFEQSAAVRWVREGPAAPDAAQASVVPPATPEGTLGQTEVEDQLSAAGITWSSSGNCSDQTNPSCTSFNGARPRTVQRTLELADAVGAENVVVTGFTETGHSRSGNYRHDNGYKVDLRTTEALNNYITTNYQQVPGRTDQWRDPDGNIYYRHEPDHWDVTVTN